VLAWTPGMGELAIILVICLVLFGSRLPSTMRSLGTSLKEFKKGMREGEGDGTGDRLQ
jgi:sec-independent protein translocase protein TatA